MSKRNYLEYGLNPTKIYCASEQGNLPERDLLLGQLIMKAFDDFDHNHQAYAGRGGRFAGFYIDTSDLPLIIKHPYGVRPIGLIENAIGRVFPNQRHLLTNKWIDTDGEVMVHGMHANDALDHPYVVACWGLVDQRAEIRLRTRLEAFEIAGIQKPSRETLGYLINAMRGVTDGVRHPIEDHMKWLNSIRSTVKGEPIKNCLEFSRIMFKSDEDKAEGIALHGWDRRPDGWTQTRDRFVMRHPGCEAIFAPFPQEDQTLSTIRDLAQNAENMMEVDAEISQVIGRDLWESFAQNPKAFCDARIDRRHEAGNIEDDAIYSP